MGAVSRTLFPGVSAGGGGGRRGRGGGRGRGNGSRIRDALLAEGRGLRSGSASVLRVETCVERASAREVGAVALERLSPGSKSHLSC